MRFKKSRQEVISEIGARVSCASYNQLRSLQYNTEFDTNSVINCINVAISESVLEGFKTLLENEYTDEDFECDMQLK
jgi:glutaminase